MIDADWLRAFAARLDRIEQERIEVGERLRGRQRELLELHAALLTVIEQPDHRPAGAGNGTGGGASQPPSRSAPLDEPGQEPLEVDGTGPGTPSGPPVEAPPAPATPSAHCPDCDWTGKPGGLGVHRRHRHGHRTTPAERVAARDQRRAHPSAPRSVAPAAGVPPLRSDEDPRVIDDRCPICGQRFTWLPAFTTHKRTCTGPKGDA